MTPAVTFVAEAVQEKFLRKTLIYRYHPLQTMRDEILAGIKEHLKSDLTEYDNVEIKIDVVMKQYDKTQLPKEYWYDKLKPNDTENT